MELKSREGVPRLRGRLVLIVPLWNWNHDQSTLPGWYDRFNRTFMELKLMFADEVESIKAVLIVPLWNWNRRKRSASPIIARFNRTFMELKLFYQWVNPNESLF